MGSTGTAGADCVVVGAGVSGLACAVRLAEEGHTVQVLEAAAHAGGRVRGGLYRGEPSDIGFQTILRGYPQTADFLETIGIGDDELRTFQRRIVIHDGARWRRVRIAGSGSIALSGLVPRKDLARLATLGARCAVGGTRELEGNVDMTAEEFLRESGLGDDTIERILRPLLGSMLLDRTLEADAGYVRFLLGMMARGPAMLPVDGMGMVVDRAVSTLARLGGMLWTGTGVARLAEEATGRVGAVILGDGRTVSARSVVLATPIRVTRTLLAPIDPAAADRLPTEPLGAVSVSFALDLPLYEEATILLDAAAPDGDDRVDLVCQTTNVTRPGSPGPHILVAQSATAGWSRVDVDAYAAAVGAWLRRRIPGYDWDTHATRIDATVHDSALYRVTPGVRAGLPGPATTARNLFLAGDGTTHPSLEGAISAGIRAADRVGELLR